MSQEIYRTIAKELDTEYDDDLSIRAQMLASISEDRSNLDRFAVAVRKSGVERDEESVFWSNFSSNNNFQAYIKTFLEGLSESGTGLEMIAQGSYNEPKGAEFQPSGHLYMRGNTLLAENLDPKYIGEAAEILHMKGFDKIELFAPKDLSQADGLAYASKLKEALIEKGFPADSITMPNEPEGLKLKEKRSEGVSFSESMRYAVEKSKKLQKEGQFEKNLLNAIKSPTNGVSDNQPTPVAPKSTSNSVTPRPSI